MAKINDVEIKSKAPIRGTKNGFRAVIYMDNARIGTLENKDDGNGTVYDIVNAGNENTCIERMNDYANHVKLGNFGINDFFNRLMALNEVEKYFKHEALKYKRSRKAFNVAETQVLEQGQLVSTGKFTTLPLEKERDGKTIKDRELQRIAKSLNEKGIKFNVLTVFTSLKDFENATVINQYTQETQPDIVPEATPTPEAITA